jgi:alpha-glucoside transport system substrate-binding protein
MKARRFTAIAAGLSVAALAVALTGCAPAEPASDGKVTIFGGYGEAQAKAFQAELTAFGEANDIEITFTSLASFDKDIKVKIEAGQAPDIALWPQPGGLLDLSDNLLPLDEVIDLAPIQETLVPGWDQLAVKDGKVYGLPVSANMKTLVFYNPAAFSAAGYSVPTTDDELKALEAKIIADGAGYPWCAGIESGGATGWAITDWIEQYVLNYNGIDAYNKWISGELDFASPEVTKAADAVAARLLAEGQVNGGGKSMATDGFGNTAPLFETGGKAKGQCFMIRQGSFITDFFPDAIKAEVQAGNYANADVFPLPAPADAATAGVIGGGDLAAAFNADADTAKVLSFILSDQVGKEMAAAGGFISPHKTFDSALYPNALFKKVGEAMAAAGTFGFDGSDRMPADVNAEFWLAGTDWVAGKITWAEAAARIDAKY